MNILVINGACLQTNSSANLCHLAYLHGLLDAGHEVTLLSADGRDYSLDKSMVIPPQIKQYTYYGVSLYERLSLRKRATAAVETMATAGDGMPSAGGLHRLIRYAKDFVLSLYGVHGIYSTFVRKAQKFRSNVEYDYILSISTPVTSHLLAHNLIAAGHIRGKHWIQIWEDPWYSDAYGFNGKGKIRREEQRLLSFAEKVCYVSPLTLRNQQRLYPESADKMYWQPLPYYYKGSEMAKQEFEENIYGYFGNYVSAARNLEPFYNAAKGAGIAVNICGDPSNLFQSTERIRIYPRLTLDKLKPIEDNTNVLIFLCNRRGGQIPGKIYQYSATSKTVLFIMDGTEEEQKVLMDFFGKFNRYVFCQNTVEDITRAIGLIESGNLGQIDSRPIEEFNPTTIIKKILDAGR